MRQRFLVVAASIALALLAWDAGVALAHHSVSATYIFGKSVRIEGTLKEFIWRNPHSFMRVEAPDDKGQKHIWIVEGAAPQQLSEGRPDGEHTPARRSGHRDRAARTHRRGPQAAAAHHRAALGRLQVRGSQQSAVTIDETRRNTRPSRFCSVVAAARRLSRCAGPEAGARHGVQQPRARRRRST